MIVLIIGDFCVGKDTVADQVINILNSVKSLSIDGIDFIGARKILSYTTRQRRYNDELTHEFCTKEEFDSFDDLVAFTEIDHEYYGARLSQFDKDYINFYVVDSKGAVDMLNNPMIDDYIFVVEVIRPKWLISCPNSRTERNRKYDPKCGINYRIMNDSDFVKLRTECKELALSLQNLKLFKNCL